MASLNRVRSSSAVGASAAGVGAPPACSRAQRRVTLAPSARYSATICSTVNPLSARPAPWASAAVVRSGGTAGARPFDFSAWA